MRPGAARDTIVSDDKDSEQDEDRNMGWFDDDDDSDDEPSRKHGTRSMAPPLLWTDGSTGGGSKLNADGAGADKAGVVGEMDPLDAYMSGVSATALAQSADAERRGEMDRDGRHDVEEEEIDPLDAYMSGLRSSSSTCATERKKKEKKVERLDVENEEEATAHWTEDRRALAAAFSSSASSASSSSLSSRRLLDAPGRVAVLGTSPLSSGLPPHAAAAAASSLASTFHRAGERKDAEFRAAISNMNATLRDGGGGGLKGDDNDDDVNPDVDADLDEDEDELEEAMMRKRQSKTIDPLDKVDHSGVAYEPFRKKFIEPRNTDRGEEWRDENDVTLDPEAVCDPVLTFDELGPARSDVASSSPASAAEKEKEKEKHKEGEGRGEGFGRNSAWAGMFPPDLMAAIASAGYATPTLVQSQTLPVALAGRDCLVTASTGSGKTIAYALPMVVHCCDQRHIDPGTDGPIGLVLTPTRELARQVHGQVRRMMRALGGHVVCVTGGEGKYEMTKELKKGCEVVVSTPGRLIDMVKAKGTNLKRVTMIVLDEADKMLDMGFEKQVSSIMDNVRPDRQMLMFSATFGKKVERVARQWLTNPVRIAVGRTGTNSKHVDQHVMVLPSHEAKKQWLIEMLPTLTDLGRTIIFVSSRADCEDVAREVRSSPAVGGRGLLVDTIHGDRHQSDRNAALSALRKGTVAALIATDVAARGLDVRGVATVVNFDAAKDLDSHVHRVGRAGRLSGGEYGRGTAYTLLTARNADFANVLVESFRREGREVREDLAKLAMQSRHFGGGGRTARWSKSGIGFHGESSSADHGAWMGGGGGGRDGRDGASKFGGSRNSYDRVSNQKQGANPPQKKSRWG